MALTQPRARLASLNRLSHATACARSGHHASGPFGELPTRSLRIRIRKQIGAPLLVRQ
jgi:hypothetical protein